MSAGATVTMQDVCARARARQEACSWQESVVFDIMRKAKESLH